MSKREVYIFLAVAVILVIVCSPWMSRRLFDDFMLFGAGMVAGATVIESKEAE